MKTAAAAQSMEVELCDCLNTRGLAYLLLCKSLEEEAAAYTHLCLWISFPIPHRPHAGDWVLSILAGRLDDLDCEDRTLQLQVYLLTMDPMGSP